MHSQSSIVSLMSSLTTALNLLTTPGTVRGARAPAYAHSREAAARFPSSPSHTDPGSHRLTLRSYVWTMDMSHSDTIPGTCVTVFGMAAVGSQMIKSDKD